MSAVQATGAEVHNAASAAGTPEAELAHKCLYYMVLMREVEDRIERKLYPAGQSSGRRLRGPRAGGHTGGQRAGVPAGRRALSVAPRHGRILRPRRARRGACSPSTWAAWAA